MGTQASGLEEVRAIVLTVYGIVSVPGWGGGLA